MTLNKDALDAAAKVLARGKSGPISRTWAADIITAYLAALPKEDEHGDA